MTKATVVVGVVLMVFGAGCTQMPGETTRAATPAMFSDMPDLTRDETMLAREAQDLEDLSRKMLRAATLKGAGIGALAGCGLASLTGSGANQCVKGAVTGGAVGALAGHATGEQQVQDMVDLNRVFPVMSETARQSQDLTLALSQKLQAQEAELVRLEAQSNVGEVSYEDYLARTEAVNAWRGDVAQRFEQSAEQAKLTRDALVAAQEAGQPGLEMYISRTTRLEEDALSARASLSLL